MPKRTVINRTDLDLSKKDSFRCSILETKMKLVRLTAQWTMPKNKGRDTRDITGQK
jgi:hypothetical protein